MCHTLRHHFHFDIFIISLESSMVLKSNCDRSWPLCRNTCLEWPYLICPKGCHSRQGYCNLNVISQWTLTYLRNQNKPTWKHLSDYVIIMYVYCIDIEYAGCMNKAFILLHQAFLYDIGGTPASLPACWQYLPPISPVKASTFCHLCITWVA